jgi:hypothetical protein
VAPAFLDVFEGDVGCHAVTHDSYRGVDLGLIIQVASGEAEDAQETIVIQVVMV